MIVAVFLFTYVGMALGRVPGLRIDRTGIALVAVAALLVFGAIEITDIGAAQHLPTLMLPISSPQALRSALLCV